MTHIVFLMPRLTQSAETPSEILSRLNVYAQTTVDSVKNESFKFSVLTSGLQEDYRLSRDSYPSLLIRNLTKSKSNFLLFAYSAFKYIWDLDNEKISLVSGENVVALPICIWIKSFSRQEIRIHTTFHGNPLSRYHRKFVKNYKGFLLRRKLKHVDSVRFVSDHLKIELEHLLPPYVNRIVAPIPIRLIKSDLVPKSEKVVGFYGRLHPERGVDEFIEILGMAKHQNLDFIIQVIGSGPLKVRVQNALLNFNNDSTNHFRESVSHETLLESLSNTNVLISCAPNEGYGLTIREAILGGTFVVARENAGTLEVKKEFPEMIGLYSTIPEAVNMIKNALTFKPSPKLIEGYRNFQIYKDGQSMTELSRSWA